MKKLLLIAFLIPSLISCQKSNDLAHTTHTIQYWTDHVASENSAWECPGDPTWTTDTTLYYNNRLPTKNLVDHKPHVINIDSVEGGFNRKYFEFLN